MRRTKRSVIRRRSSSTISSVGPQAPADPPEAEEPGSTSPDSKGVSGVMRETSAIYSKTFSVDEVVEAAEADVRRGKTAALRWK